MNARQWSMRLAWLLDVLALVALAGTGEIRVAVFIPVALLFSVAAMTKWRAPSRVVLSAMGMVLVGVLLACFELHLHPIIAAAYAAPLIHSMIWFNEDTGRNRGWRLSIGFGELILASALTADAYLFIAIFVYVIFGAVAASCLFLDSELEGRNRELASRPLPSGYVMRSFGLAVVCFLTSLLIFPILPRTHLDGMGKSDQVQVGYTEDVSLAESLDLNGNEGTGQPVLWLYPRGDVDLTTDIYLGLIRGRTLDVFDGMRWRPSRKRERNVGVHYVSPALMEHARQVDVVRGAMPTSSLPVPYGAMQVYNGSGANQFFYPRTRGGEWVDPSSAQEQTRYSFAFYPYWSKLTEDRRKADPPLPTDLAVPERLRTSRMEHLAKSVFAQAHSAKDKAMALLGYLEKNKFSAAIGKAPGLDLRKFPALEKMHPIERFLFVTKRGTCEWFASASAVLLRLAGVPARLVAGFRLSKGPVGGVLSLTTQDAHAWVEYWRPSKGWVPLDPTPRLIRPPGLLNWFRDAYDWISGYWYKYVLMYRGGNKHRSRIQETPPDEATGAAAGFKKWLDLAHDRIAGHEWQLVLAIGIFLFLGLGIFLFLRWRYPWIFSIRFRVREGSVQLRRERIRLERILSARLRREIEARDALKSVESELPERQELHLSVRQWQELYQRIRFGPSEEESPASLTQLRRLYVSVKRELKAG